MGIRAMPLSAGGSLKPGRANTVKEIAAMKIYLVVMISIGISVLIGCAGTQSGETRMKTDAVLITPEHLKDVAGIEWHLKRMKINNESISLIKDTRITFSCDENAKVAGVASINRYFGNFNLKDDGDIIWSKAFGMTRMAGPPDLMDQEAKFMQALPLTARLYLRKGLLVLTSTDRSTVLEFEKI